MLYYAVVHLGLHCLPKYPFRVSGLQRVKKQVAQWATIAHLGASIMFGDTIIDDAQMQVTLNLKQ